MTLENYKVSNNGKSTLQAGISAVIGSLILATGTRGLFPSTFPFFLTLEQFDASLNVTKREIVKVTGGATEALTIVRSAGYCPLNYTATTLTNTAQSFNAGDSVKLKLVSEIIDDINAELIRLETAKLPRSEFDAEKIPFAASSAGDDDFEIMSADILTYQNGRTFKVQADVANTGASTLKLNALAAKPLKKLAGGVFANLSTGDIIANQIFWATYNSVEDCFQFSVDPASITITVPDADEATKGISERANDTEADIGSDTTRFINAKQRRFGERNLYPQPIVITNPGTTQQHRMTTAITGFSTTEPIFTFSMASTGGGGRITRWLKQKDGSLVATHQIIPTSLTANSEISGCVIGDYVYVGCTISGTRKIMRYDKADLANETTMTISGTLSGTRGIFSDGTFLYDVYTAGNIRKFSISGTTATEITTIAFTSIVADANHWCDGTNVYEQDASAGFSKWLLTGGAKTATGSNPLSGQFLIAGGTAVTQNMGVLKEADNPITMITALTNNVSGFQSGKIITIPIF